MQEAALIASESSRNMLLYAHSASWKWTVGKAEGAFCASPERYSSAACSLLDDFGVLLES